MDIPVAYAVRGLVYRICGCNRDPGGCLDRRALLLTGGSTDGL